MASGNITTRTNLATPQPTMLLYAGLSPFGVTDDRKITANALFAEITANITDLSVQFGDGVAAAVSAAGKGKLIYNDTAKAFQVSADGGAYASVLKAGPITTSGLTQATSRLLGRTTAGTGAIEEITIGSGMSLAAGSLTNLITPAGVTNSVQVNNGGGLLDGDAKFTYDIASGTVIVGSSGSVGKLKFRGTGASNGVSFVVNNPASDFVYTLPDVAPTLNQFLQATAVAGVSITLGWGTAASGLVVGTTPVTSGTAGRLFYETAGNVLGEVSGATSNGSAVTFTSGNLLATSPVFTTDITTPLVKSAAGDNLAATATAPAAATGASQAGKAVTITASPAVASLDTAGAATGGTVTIASGAAVRLTSGSANGGNIEMLLGAGIGTGTQGQIILPQGGTASAPLLAFKRSNGLTRDGIFSSADDVINFTNVGNIMMSLTSGAQVRFGTSQVGFASSAGGLNDVTVRRGGAAANLAFGSTDAAAPVAQTLSVQNVVAGTTDTAGANWTFDASRGTGTGIGGSIIWRVAPAGSTGSTQNALSTAITINSTGSLLMGIAGGMFSVASGTNQRAGNATLVAGTVTVSNATVTANTIVMLTRKTSGGTIGTAITYTVSAGTSFTITSDNILDTSVFSYFLIEVA